MSMEIPSAAPAKELTDEERVAAKLNKFTKKPDPASEQPASQPEYEEIKLPTKEDAEKFLENMKSPGTQPLPTEAPQETQPNQEQLESDPLSHLSPEQQAYWTEIFANQRELDKSGEHVMVSPMDLKEGDIIITNAGRFSSSGHLIKNYLKINKVNLNLSGPNEGSVDITTENVDGQRGTTYGIAIPKTGAPLEVIRPKTGPAQETPPITESTTELTPEQQGKIEQLQNDLKLAEALLEWEEEREKLGKESGKVFDEHIREIDESTFDSEEVRKAKQVRKEELLGPFNLRFDELKQNLLSQLKEVGIITDDLGDARHQGYDKLGYALYNPWLGRGDELLRKRIDRIKEDLTKLTGGSS